MAEITPIRRQGAPAQPARAAAPPPTPAAPPPDGSIRFAVTKPMIVVGVLAGIVLAALLYLSGFFTAVALLLSAAPVAADRPADTALQVPVTAPPRPVVVAPVATAAQATTIAPVPAADGTRPKQATDPARSAATASATTDDKDDARKPEATAIASPPPAPAPAKAAPPPVSAELADRQDLRIMPDGRITAVAAEQAPVPAAAPPPAVSPSAPGGSGQTTAAADAPALPMTKPERPIPATLPETRRLPATRDNVLLSRPPAPPQRAVDSPAWSLQAGAFLDVGHAERLIAILSKRGYEAYVLASVDNQGRNWQRVRFGRYGSRDDAAEAAQQFRRTENREVIPVRRLIDRTAGNQ